MSDEKKMKQAQAVYGALCSMLDERGWRYDKNDEKMTIHCGAQGDDLPMNIVMEVDMKRELISLLSMMPFAIPENRRIPMAIAVSRANYGLIDGSFDYDCTSGKIIFRLTSSYTGSLIGKNLLSYMLSCSCYTIDEYNDKFLMVAKNDMTTEQILEFIK